MPDHLDWSMICEMVLHCHRGSHMVCSHISSEAWRMGWMAEGVVAGLGLPCLSISHPTSTTDSQPEPSLGDHDAWMIIEGWVHPPSIPNDRIKVVISENGPRGNYTG